MMSKISFENRITELAVIFSIVSFTPNNSISKMCTIIMYLLWMAVAVFKLLNKTIKVDRTVKAMIAAYIIWFVCTKVFYLLNFYPSSGLGVASYLRYCIIFYVIGLNYQISENDSVKKLVFSFFIGQLILMLTLIPNIRSLIEAYQLFGAKNQMGQMLGIGIILELFILPDYFKSVILKAVYYVCGLVSFVVLLILHSRTPLIALIVVGTLYFLQIKDKTVKHYMTAAVVILMIGFVINKLGGIAYIMTLFNIPNRSENFDLNNLTSGRLEFYKEAINDFIESPIWGIGAFAYVDNFIFNILRCGGLLLAVIIIPLSYGKLFSGYRMSVRVLDSFDSIYIDKKPENIHLAFTLLKSMIVFYFVISLMEGYPPLGPGTSVFFMWIVLGLSYNIWNNDIYDKLKSDRIGDEKS